MNFNELIQNNTLFIASSNFKQEMLHYIDKENLFYRIKCMTMEEFLDRFLFSYDEEAVVFFSQTYHVKPSVAKIYLKNMKFIGSEIPDVPFLQKLKKQKDVLEANGLLHHDFLFSSILESYKVVVIGPVSNFERNILKQVEQITTVSFIEKESTQPHLISLYTFDQATSMVEYVANEVIRLVQQGISLNTIYLMNVNDDVQSALERTFFLYGIPLRKKDKPSLYGTYFSEKVKEVLSTATTFSDIENALKEYDAYPDFLKILNRYTFYEGNIQEIKDFLLDDLKNCKYPVPDYEEAVSILPFSSEVAKDSYVFLFDFNQDFPKSFKDEDFLSDDMKSRLGLWTSTEQNYHNRKETIRCIYSFSHVILLYRKISGDGEMYLSSLKDDLLVEDKKVEPSHIIYSPLAKKLELARKFDLHQKYGIIDQEGKNLAGFFSDIGYQSYQHKYSSINRDDLLNFCNHCITLSYSDLNQYYQCSFAYYLNKILKLDTFEESFYTIVGNIFHAILATCFQKPNFSFDVAWDEEISKYSFDAKEKFFLIKLKQDLQFIIETIKKQMSVSSFSHILCEKKISLVKHVSGLEVTFKGFVDKILYTEDMGMTYVAIIDYKTGNPELDLKLASYGLSLQLPIYLYLVSKSNLFSNVKFTGFYLQKILNNEIRIQKGKTYQGQKEDNLKLQGYTNSAIAAMSKIDKDYMNSSVVKGLKCSKTGKLSAYANVQSDDQMDSLVQLVDDKVNNCITAIAKADFKINPKVIDGKNRSCGYCPFHAICYHDDQDLEWIFISENEEEGEEDAQMD